MKKIKTKEVTPIFRYGIAKIKAISFFVNESTFIPDPTKLVKVEMSPLVGTNVSANLIDFRLKTYFYYPENPEVILSEIVVQNIFSIENLNQFFKNNEIILPSELLISFVSLSISHSRALLCQNLSGTVFQDFVVPITNPIDATKRFFPSIINKETGELNTFSSLQNMGVKM